MTFNHIVTNEESGKTILSLLKNRFHFSTRLIIHLKQQERGILKNGARAFTNAILQEGDQLCLNLEETEDSCQVIPQDIPISVIYEDEALIVLNKPADTVIHPTHNYQSGTLSNGLAYHYNKQGLHTKIRPVSRLDRDTSGLVLFAKNAWVQDCLSNRKIQLQMKKQYIALTHGIWAPTQGTIDLPIARVPGSTIEREISEEGDRAVTHYTTLQTFANEYSLMEFTLETGRTHQIRVHCKASGHPIVGDTLYYSDAYPQTLGLTRQALHSHRLTFVHPFTQKEVCLSAPLPADMEKALQKLQTDILK